MARTTKPEDYAVKNTAERILEMLAWKGHATEQEICEELQVHASEFRRSVNRLISEDKIGTNTTGDFFVVGG